MREIEENVKRIFTNIFKLSKTKINNKSNYKNIKKWDSLNHVKLIMALESKFKISIDPDAAITLLSYSDIMNYLKKLISSSTNTKYL